MTPYDNAAVEALIIAARAVLDSDTDDEGGLLSVPWRRAGALREAVERIAHRRCKHPGCRRVWVPGILSPPDPVPDFYCAEHAVEASP